MLSLALFDSCSKDDDSSSSVKNSLIGAWKTSMSSSNWRSIYIAPNGNLKYSYVTKENLKKYTYDEKTNTYYYSSDGYGWTYDPDYNAHWAFDETTNSISMYTDDGYYTYSYKVKHTLLLVSKNNQDTCETEHRKRWLDYLILSFYGLNIHSIVESNISKKTTSLLLMGFAIKK